ncbi:MAG TPA: DUF6525 family protein [Candidatus Angelobacter sp.]|nr:DUF6525 family protein [Candidatus Angelobacter sp.]
MIARSNVEPGALYTLNQVRPEQAMECIKEKGAVLIRSGSWTIDDFQRLSNELLAPMVHHATSTIERDPVNSDATISTVNKGMDDIPFHREGSYAPGCPDLLMFYCVKPASDAGETTLCDGVALFQALPPQVRQFVQSAMLVWSWEALPERWRTYLRASSTEEALKRIEAMQSRLSSSEQLSVEFAGDILHGKFTTPCITATRWGGYKAFCNSLLIHHFRLQSKYFAKDRFSVALADDSLFPADVLTQISAHADDLTVKVKWEPGDILIVDNSRFMHGRRAFQDSSRKILICMGHLRK